MRTLMGVVALISVTLSLSLLKLIYTQWRNDPNNRQSSQRHIYSQLIIANFTQSTRRSICCLSRPTYVHPSRACHVPWA